MKKVRMWEEKILIPTYKAAEPDKNPLFFEKRVYQGSSGKVYPLPVTEKISDEKEDVEYNVVFLENEYLKIMVLPELGGRIQRAYDKTNDYDFVYYNHVIKPALVGLVGPWISGGIEFNWPQHHRPSTFMPTEYTLKENEDGSKTVFVSEIDQMYGTKGMAGFTLYPDKAYIEITGQLFNRTDVPQTFLWWANPAVPVNDHTFSVFPPDVHAVMDHGKRAVSSFPIATGTYYKYDYSSGIDISRYENIEVPTSYMAYHSDYDFIGNYDEQKKAGLLHVADHHISPGKKQWTWGNSDFGQAWDRNLTDEDGPYIELMTGVFTDNQPDFTWLKPYEEKTFTQYFMPYKGVGRVKNATKKAAVNVEIIDGKTVIKLYATENIQDAQITLSKDDEVIFSDVVSLTPQKYYEVQLNLPIKQIDQSVKVAVSDSNREIIVGYQGIPKVFNELPDPAEALLKPETLKSTEELFLAATHIEQYRHATLNAEDYYLEGLKRDASDIRLNNSYGMFLYKQGKFTESEKYFQKAVEKQTWRSPNPYYGEPLFNLGLSLLMQNKFKESYDVFYKATWSDDTQGAAFYQLACLAAREQKYTDASYFVEKALIRNQHNMKARVLQVALTRALGDDFTNLIEQNLDIDILDLGSLYEEYLKTGSLKWEKAMRGSVNNYIELASDYLIFGFLTDTLDILSACPNKNPMVYYFMAYVAMLQKKTDEAKKFIQLGETASPNYCFPNKLLELKILMTLLESYPNELQYGRYYLGNLLYDKKRYEEAIKLWESSLDKLKEFPTVYRNLSFAYYNQYDNQADAFKFLSKAVELDNTDGRLLLELDILKAKMGVDPSERLMFLEKQIQTTKSRDDLFVEYITLLNNAEEYDKAYKAIMSRQFHPWEGGEGKVSTQYVYALINLANDHLQKNPIEAITYLNKALERPFNLGEGKLPDYFDNITHYYLGQAYNYLGDQQKSIEHYKLATRGSNQPENVMYYNDQPADLILYKGLAHIKLEEIHQAKTCFHKLLSYGEKHIFDHAEYEYFAVSLPSTVVFKDDLDKKNKIYCKYLMSLGNIGLSNLSDAKKMLNEILEEVPDHQGAIQHLKFIN